MTGTIEMLPAGAFGVDDSFQPPSLADMLAIGAQFESRYVCIENDLTRPKLWTLDRLHRNADAGILAMVNYEQSVGTTLTGDAGGRRHGKVAADWRAYLGMPPDLPIVISTDQGVTSSQYSAISDFCAAFQQESGGPIGHYHGTTLCAHLEAQGLNELTWMAMATSWSPGGETAAVHVRQKGYVLGGCDANYVRKSTPFWNINGDPPTPPDKIETRFDMPALFQSNDAIHWPGSPTLAAGDYPPNNGHVFTLDVGGAVRHVPSDEFLTYLALKYPVAMIPGARLGGMISTGGVYTPGSGGGGATEQQVRDLIDGTYLQTGT